MSKVRLLPHWVGNQRRKSRLATRRKPRRVSKRAPAGPQTHGRAFHGEIATGNQSGASTRPPPIQGGNDTGSTICQQCDELHKATWDKRRSSPWVRWTCRYPLFDRAGNLDRLPHCLQFVFLI